MFLLNFGLCMVHGFGGSSSDMFLRGVWMSMVYAVDRYSGTMAGMLQSKA